VAQSKVKIKWEVEPPPSGKWRSFERRGWPSAVFRTEKEHRAAIIHCADEYVPAKVKTGDHAKLAVSIADWRDGHKGEWLKMIPRFSTLKQAKEFIAETYAKFPQYLPAEYR
jgi:hypothetical protein